MIVSSAVSGQDACFRVADGYARTDWNGVLGGCHEPYYRTDCSGFVSMVGVGGGTHERGRSPCAVAGGPSSIAPGQLIVVVVSTGFGLGKHDVGAEMSPMNVPTTAVNVRPGSS